MKCNAKQKSLILLFTLFFMFFSNVHAAILTWVNGSGDGRASTASNWSAGAVPQDGDTILFDNTSVDNCIWDLPLTLNNMKVLSGYSGTVTISTASNLTLDKTIEWTGEGTDNLASNPLNWSGRAVPVDGDKIVFNDSASKNCSWDIGISPALLSISSAYSGTLTLNEYLSIGGNLTVAGGVLDLNSQHLIVNGYVLIGINGSLNAASSTIEVKGDWANGGSFIQGTSTVRLSGEGQTIYGNTTFYSLIKTVNSDDILYFEDGTTQTIVQSLIFQGVEDNLLSMRSKTGDYFYIDPQGSRNISFASIRDMNNINFVNIVPLYSVDEGHNDDVNFGGSECACAKNKWDYTWICSSTERGIC